MSSPPPHRPADATEAHPPAPPGDAAPPTLVPGYEILGELGRGGMGAVLRGRDLELGRDLAVKVLLERLHDEPDAVRRFVEEARVGGRLQHPGVVPVYATGRLPDARPYFTMKLVEGRTLADLLRERKTPLEDLPRFLKVFEQVCQTTAYAHSRGVIHRDLKPQNVMVGAFGEVQVMDWGLAKVLKNGALADQTQAAAVGMEGQSAAGTVVETAAYMPPEQARGEAADERSDVFGLGAILCEVLTGSPPYRGEATWELLGRAATADLSDAFARLDGCGADAELVRLAMACLAAAPADRPADAGAVAAAMTAHLAGVQERLRRAELARAAAQARAAEERKRRRLTLALAATVLLGVSGAAAGALWYQHDQAVRASERARKAADTERDVTAALDEAAALGEQAKALTGDPARWEAALARALSAAERADGLLRSGVGAESLRPRVDALSAELRAADRDRILVAALDAARLSGALGGNEGGFDNAGAAALYAEAFKKDEPEWNSLTAEEAAGRIKQRVVADEMLAALDDWISLVPKSDTAGRLRAILRSADPDPASFRNRSTALLDQKDGDGLRQLAFAPEAGRVPTESLVNLGSLLYERGSAEGAVKFLKEVNERRPGDFWVLFELANALRRTDPPETAEAIRYFTAALALRPTSAAGHNNLANALDAGGRLDEAIAEHRKALALRPEWALGHYNLAVALNEKKSPDDAIAELRLAVKLDPDFGAAHNNLGMALQQKGRMDEAIVEYRQAAKRMPDFVPAHANLGNLLRLKGQYGEAVAEFRRVVELQPDNMVAYVLLGLTLREQGRFTESLAAYRRFRELTSEKPQWQAQSAEWLREAEELARLNRLLPVVQGGAAEPSTSISRLGFARVCRYRRLYAAAARFYGDAFAAEPGLAEAPGDDRSDAARVAVQVGCGLGEDARTIDATERDRWRMQALVWLRADLEMWTKAIAGGAADERDAAVQALQHWKEEADLAGVRDADPVARLPAEEQDVWRKLWADVDAALMKASK